MPYMVGYTDDVEKGLFLRQFDVPFWACHMSLGEMMIIGIVWRTILDDTILYKRW
jgi:hypothetical protein